MIRKIPKDRRPRLVSFSGIDGAGKSTQIGSLYTRLCDAGVRTRLLVFWEDVAMLARFRAFATHVLFKGNGAVGAPANPVNRRDKNVRSWYMTGLRFFLYFLDAISLSIVVARRLRSDADVVIFDRYLYDELANLSLEGRITRRYVRLLLNLVPQPDVAYLLDADPVQARHRKPEYPIEFLRSHRASYLALSTLVGGMTVIEPVPQLEVERIVAETLLHELEAVRTELSYSSFLS